MAWIMPIGTRYNNAMPIARTYAQNGSCSIYISLRRRSLLNAVTCTLVSHTSIVNVPKVNANTPMAAYHH